MPSFHGSAAYRIAFTYAAAFAAAILLLGATVYFAADAQFRQRRDGTISEELQDLSQEGPSPRIILEIAKREQWSTRDAFGYALFDGAGQRIGGKMETVRPPLGFSTITLRHRGKTGETMRARAVDVDGGHRLVVALNSKGVDAIDHTILTLFAGAFLVVLAIGTGGALVLGRYLRARLGAMSATANAIVAGEAGKRMPVGPRGDEFDAVATALNAMLDRIERLMENLRQVSSDVAHDLRTPLMRLRNQLDLVGRVPGAEERAIALGDELLVLFGAILRIAEVEGGDLARTFGVVDLSELIGSVGEDFLPAFADSAHRLEVSVARGHAVQGNRELLAQATVNLLDNALVHTPAGTVVRLVLDSDGPDALLSVTDNGPGVDATDRPNLFRRFFRTQASRTTPGNGLGLSLVAAVAAAHGGTIEIEDAGPGLRVAIRLQRFAG